MSFCPNPDCPHKKSTGRPAEFSEGVTQCSHCGTALVEEVTEGSEARKFTLSDFQKRFLWTIGFVVLWRVLVSIPVPGVNLEALEKFFQKSGRGLTFTVFSLIALGVMPYLTAYMVVEIISLFIQPLKSWRDEGYQGRLKIKTVALVATFLLAFWQGYGVARGLEGMVGIVGEKIVRNPGLSFRLISALTLTAGTFLTIWIADLISKKGVGHGISILLLTAYAGGIFFRIPEINSLFPGGQISPLSYLLFSLSIIAILALVVLVERSKRKIAVRFNDGTEAYIPLKLTSAGITPVEWASMLIMLPTTLLLFTKTKHFQWLVEALAPIGFSYFIIDSIVIIFLYYLFTSFFYDPKRIIARISNKGASIVSPPGKRDEDYFDKSLESMIPVGVLYLILIVFIPKIASRFLSFILEGTVLITIIAIILDLMEEVRLRRKGNNFVKVAELHDVPMAGLLKSLLEQKGLSCFLRGYYHRALLYFFGPYIEISVLVPEDKMAEARELVARYIDSKLLTTNVRA